MEVCMTTKSPRRYYAAPCDDDKGRTWDVMQRQSDGSVVCVEQGHRTRAAARKRAAVHERAEEA
jgi:hypothetical protein